MGKFPIIRSTRGLPGASTAVRAGFDTSSGAEAIGQAVGEFGTTLSSGIKRRTEKRERLRLALEEKNRKNLDVRENRKAQLATEDYLRDIDGIKKINPPENWAGLIGERSTQYKSEQDTRNLSPEARERLNIEIEGVANKVEDQAFIDGTLRLKATALETAEEASVALFREGRPAREDLRDQIEIMRFNGMNLKEIEAVLDNAKEAGLKLRNEDAVEAIGNEAVSNPEVTLQRVLAEQAARKAGKGTIPEEELSDKDLVSAERIAKNRIDEIKRDTEESINDAQEEEENKIYEGLDDGTMTSADIVGNKVIDVAAKRRLQSDNNKFVQMDLQKSWPLTDNDTVVQDLNTKLTEQSSGLTDINEMNKSINAAAASGQLTKETRDKMRTQAKKGGLDAIDEQVNASTRRVKNALLGRLSEREARFKVRALSRELTRDEQREAQSVGFLFQVGVEQLNRFEAELNKRMRETGKETLSGTEVESLAAQVWDKFKNKDDAQRIREFKEFTGKRVPKPDGFSDAVWNESNLETRAEIVTSVSNGLTNKQITEALGK